MFQILYLQGESVRGDKNLGLVIPSFEERLEEIRNSDLKTIEIRSSGGKIFLIQHTLFFATPVCRTLTKLHFEIPLQLNVLKLCFVVGMFTDVLEEINLLVYVTNLSSCLFRDLATSLNFLKHVPSIKFGNFGTTKEAFMALKELRSTAHTFLYVTWFATGERNQLQSDKIVLTEFIRSGTTSVNFYSSKAYFMHVKELLF